MSLSTKSQLGMEIIILISVLFLGSIAITTASYLKTIDYSYSVIGLRASQILDKTVERINTVVFEGDGFSSTLYIDEYLLGEKYNISLSNDLVLISFRGNIISKEIVAKSISGILSKGKNWVSNQNGTIIIS